MPTESPNSSKRPEEQDSQLMLGQLVAEHYFVGPMPPPGVLREYEKILPGSAEKIFQDAQSQLKHREAVEDKIVRSEITNAKLGLWFGFIIGMTAIITGGWVSAKVSTGAGSVISISAIAALAGVFVYGSKQRSKEQEEKQDSQ